MAMDFKLDLPKETSFASGEEKDRLFDLIILGGGPAGMTAAVYAMRKKMNTVLISPDLGGQLLWTSGVENYLGFHYIDGPVLAKKFSEQIHRFPIKVALGEQAQAVHQQHDDRFAVTTEAGRTIRGRTLILTTGKRNRELGVPGEDHYRGRGVSYCAVCDGPFFAKQPVVIAGGGNSALTAAIDMLEQGCQVTLVNSAEGWQGDPVLLEKIHNRVTLLDRTRITEIQGNAQGVTGVALETGNGETRVLPVKGVFVEIGLLPNTDLFHGFVEMNDRGEIMTDCAARTSRPGVYAAGDCTMIPDKQIIIAAGDGAKAALSAYRHVKFRP